VVLLENETFFTHYEFSYAYIRYLLLYING